MRVLQIIIVVGGLLISILIIRTILRAVTVQERIDRAQEEVVSLEKEQIELKGRLENATSSAFIEEAAREKLGLGKPGETVVVLPDEEFLKSLSPEIVDDEPPYAEASDGEPNWKKWLKLFF